MSPYGEEMFELLREYEPQLKKHLEKATIDQVVCLTLNFAKQHAHAEVKMRQEMFELLEGSDVADDVLDTTVTVVLLMVKPDGVHIGIFHDRDYAQADQIVLTGERV